MALNDTAVRLAKSGGSDRKLADEKGLYRSDDLISFQTAAQTALLLLPASTLYGVILKVELMIDAYAGRDLPGAGSILGDLHRFARNAELAWCQGGAC